MYKNIRRSSFIFKVKTIITAVILSFSISGILSGEQIIHKVDNRDTLFGISLLYNTSVEKISELNNLSSEMIKTGEELLIPAPQFTYEPNKQVASIKTYTVRRGDTLSEIASDLDMEQKQIAQLNKLPGDSIRMNQVLQIPQKAQSGNYYFVESGDTLSRISLLFDISLDQLKQINNLESATLRLGQKIYVAPQRPQTYTVEKGDSLWNIAVMFDLDMGSLMAYNELSDGSIFPGQDLNLYSYVVDDFEMPRNNPPVLMASYQETPLDEYSNYEDAKETQPSRSYSETRLEDPETNYNQAREIMGSLDRSISRERRLSNALAGYTIVLDPGHGGLDPGAIVPSENGNGEMVYVVEDEYAYDISLRTYRLLKLHGADVTMTIISPNHQIRSSANPSETFVNMKNEVYNSKSLNKAGDDSCWPVGGSRGLRKRVEVAQTAFSGADRNKTLFVSIHADNSPDHGQGTMVLYSSENEKNIEESIELAESLTPYLGASSFTEKQNLAVLRDNPAYAEVLIEIRNLHYPGNSWAIRYDKLREQDAEFITSGLINYAENR